MRKQVVEQDRLKIMAQSGSNYLFFAKPNIRNIIFDRNILEDCAPLFDSPSISRRRIDIYQLINFTIKRVFRWTFLSARVQLTIMN